MTIFFKNAFLNWVAFLALIVITWFLNIYLLNEPNYKSLWITIIVAVSSIAVAFINANVVSNKKDHEKMATKDELSLVIKQLTQYIEANDRQFQQHLNSNDESYSSLFELNKQIKDDIRASNDKVHELSTDINNKLFTILKEARIESKTEETRDDQRKKDFKKR